MIKKIHRNGYWFQIDYARPFMRFHGGGTSSSKLPPAPDPIPTPEDIDLQAAQKGEDERRKLRSKKGRGSTILTETLGVSEQAKSPILGVVGE